MTANLTNLIGSLFVKLILVLVTTACITPLHQRPSQGEQPKETIQSLNLDKNESPEELPAESKETIAEVEKEILEADEEILQAEATIEEQEKSRKSTHAKIPFEINANVIKWIRYFTEKDRERFHRQLKRGSEYKDLVKSILKENGVPTEFYYLAMIESGYLLHARSHAQAVGVWQFIRGTGLRYGLDQNYYVDERRDIIRATHAAAKYLRNLHNAFQSWYLAMAGYNAGEGRVLGAIMKGGTRDFWELVEKRALPAETRNYVPKFLAATIIGKNPEKYGFFDIDSPPFPKAEEASVPGGVRLSDIAKKTHTPLALLKKLNPHLIRGITPAGEENYSLWVPEGSADQLSELQTELAQLRIKTKRHLASGSGQHRVRRGETLESIARRYKTSIRTLKYLNNLRSSRIYAGQKLVVRETAGENNKIIYRVKSGDALTLISQRYEVPVQTIKKANDLDSNRIYAGQKLIIPREI